MFYFNKILPPVLKLFKNFTPDSCFNVTILKTPFIRRVVYHSKIILKCKKDCLNELLANQSPTVILNLTQKHSF